LAADLAYIFQKQTLRIALFFVKKADFLLLSQLDKAEINLQKIFILASDA